MCRHAGRAGRCGRCADSSHRPDVLLQRADRLLAAAELHDDHGVRARAGVELRVAERPVPTAEVRRRLRVEPDRRERLRARAVHAARARQHGLVERRQPEQLRRGPEHRSGEWRAGPEGNHHELHAQGRALHGHAGDRDVERPMPAEASAASPSAACSSSRTRPPHGAPVAKPIDGSTGAGSPPPKRRRDNAGPDRSYRLSQCCYKVSRTAIVEAGQPHDMPAPPTRSRTCRVATPSPCPVFITPRASPASRPPARSAAGRSGRSSVGTVLVGKRLRDL